MASLFLFHSNPARECALLITLNNTSTLSLAFPFSARLAVLQLSSCKLNKVSAPISFPPSPAEAESLGTVPSPHKAILNFWLYPQMDTAAATASSCLQAQKGAWLQNNNSALLLRAWAKYPHGRQGDQQPARIHQR